jgi:hypothetical protein
MRMIGHGAERNDHKKHNSFDDSHPPLGMVLEELSLSSSIVAICRNSSWIGRNGQRVLE